MSHASPQEQPLGHGYRKAEGTGRLDNGNGLGPNPGADTSATDAQVAMAARSIAEVEFKRRGLKELGPDKSGLTIDMLAVYYLDHARAALAYVHTPTPLPATPDATPAGGNRDET